MWFRCVAAPQSHNKRRLARMQLRSLSATFPMCRHDIRDDPRGLPTPNVTLIVALRGKDGIVLAADTKGNETHSPFSVTNQELISVECGLHSSKILTSKRHGIMAAFAETDEGMEAAKLFINNIDAIDEPPNDLAAFLKTAGEQSCKDSPARVPGKNAQIGSIITVNANDNYRPLLRSRFIMHPDGKFIPNIVPSADCHIAGYSANSALFFIEKYYSYTNMASVNELAVLAGHVILTASRISQHIIEGLEIAICKPNETPQFVQPQSIEEIKQRSEQIIKSTGNFLKALPEIHLASDPK